MQTYRIGIVGGGPGGLMSAYFLEKFSNSLIEITLFEASERLGGKIITPKFQSVPASYEAGAAEFYDYSHFDEDPLKELIAELGLSISPMGGSAVIMNDQLLSNMDDVERSLGLEVKQDLQAFDQLAHDLQIPQEFYHSDHPEGSLTLADPKLFDTVLAKTRPKTRAFIETLIHSDLATEPALTNIPYGLQNYLMNDTRYMQLYGIQGGNEQLPQELAARLSAKINLHHRVTNIRKSDNQISIHSSCEGQSYDEAFDFVIIALPHNQIPRLNFSGEQLANAVKKHHDHFNYPAHYLRMTLLFESPFWRSVLTDSYWMLDAFEGCCLYDESSRTPGSKYGILGWLIGGKEALEMSDWDDAELIQAALDSLPSFFKKGRTEFIEGQVHRWPCAVNGQPGGDVQWKLDQRHQPEPEQHPHLFFVGDYMYDSTLNGVIDSAVYVSEWISSTMQTQAGTRLIQQTQTMQNAFALSTTSTH